MCKFWYVIGKGYYLIRSKVTEPAMVSSLAEPAPVVGSSRKRMEGWATSAHAMLSRRCSPPDSPRTRMPPGSTPPTCMPTCHDVACKQFFACPGMQVALEADH